MSENDKTIKLLTNLISLRVDSLNTAKQKLKELKSEIVNIEKDIEDTLLDIDDYNLAITKLKIEKEVIENERENTGINKPSKK